MIDLEAIKAREAAATKGPWTFFDGDTGYQTEDGWEPGYPPCVAACPEDDFDSDATVFEGSGYLASEQSAANLKFAAHARDDIPALIAELESLRSQLAAANEAKAKAETELCAALDAGIRIVGLQSAAAGYATTNSEDRAKFLAMAGLED